MTIGIFTCVSHSKMRRYFSYYSQIFRIFKTSKRSRRFRRIQNIQTKQDTEDTSITINMPSSGSSSSSDSGKEKCDVCFYEVVKCCACGQFETRWVGVPCTQCYNGETVATSLDNDPIWIDLCEACTYDARRR